MHADDHEAAAADVAAARIDHGERVAHRDRRIDGVPTLAQHLHADLRGEMLLGDDHRMTRDDGARVPPPAGGRAGTHGENQQRSENANQRHG